MAGLQTADAGRHPATDVKLVLYHWPAYICTFDIVVLTLLLLLTCVFDNDISANCRATPPHMPSRLPHHFSPPTLGLLLAFYRPDINSLPAPSMLILPEYLHTIQHTSSALCPVGSYRPSAHPDKPITAA
jgi:hypothetical protein